MRRLLIRPGAIGDCILAFPAMEYLAADYTEVWISSAVVPLIQFADVVRPLSSTGLDLVGVGDLQIQDRLALHLRSFDSIVSWYGAGRAEFVEAISGLGVVCEFLAALPPAWYMGPAVDFFAQQVGAPAGLTPRIDVDKPEFRDRVVIHPFSGSKRKNWPLNLYRQISLQLPVGVEWIAGPEEALAEAVRFESLHRLASWVSGARLYIGNDSGITHLASATGMPVLALFGPTNPALWAPRGENVTVLSCDPLDELPVERVLEAAQRLLA
ncbi:MAG: glycosyltransferase family 9 protein [Acidobacteriota bacterium]|nr:glycosyltransferase family 9 protein [Acidobacteriota bacterium]